MIKWGKCPCYVLDVLLSKDQICLAGWIQGILPFWLYQIQQKKSELYCTPFILMAIFYFDGKKPNSLHALLTFI